jgi:hypothetical protein
MAKIIYGECIGPRASAPVRISALADHGCNLETDDLGGVSDGDVTLWIGAIGPFSGKAIRMDASHAALHFNEPLDGRILHHFLG